MGKGKRIWTVGLLSTALAACSPDAPQANEAGDASAPAPAATASTVTARSPLREWLIGTWSFDTSCATDFLIRYEGDGRLDNAGEVGTWALADDQLTETVTERFENGGEAPVRVDPPTMRTYAVARKDATHGTITFQKRAVPIQRC
jgi:hypothetical protein